MYLYEYKESELAIGLRERLEESQPDATGYKSETFVCLHCGSMEVLHWSTDENGNFQYRCEDCESIINENELELI